MPRMILEYSQDINLKNSCKIVPIKQYYELSKTSNSERSVKNLYGSPTLIVSFCTEGAGTVRQ